MKIRRIYFSHTNLSPLLCCIMISPKIALIFLTLSLNCFVWQQLRTGLYVRIELRSFNYGGDFRSIVWYMQVVPEVNLCSKSIILRSSIKAFMIRPRGHFIVCFHTGMPLDTIRGLNSYFPSDNSFEYDEFVSAHRFYLFHWSSAFHTQTWCQSAPKDITHCLCRCCTESQSNPNSREIVLNYSAAVMTM